KPPLPRRAAGIYSSAKRRPRISWRSEFAWRSEARALRHQAIAAGLGHQDLRLGGIALDLLAQAIDMRLERMRPDAGIVAPDLVQKRVAADDLVAGAVEVLEDRRFLLGQAHFLAAAFLDQQLGARAEGIGADREDRILAELVLAELRAQPRQQHVQAEG